MLTSKISIRELVPGEEKAILEFLKKSLGLIKGAFFFFISRDALRSALKRRGKVLVALCDGRIVGSTSLRILSYAEKKLGIIDTIATDRELRGRGIGKSLLDEALSWFKGERCEAVYAIVDRYNSPSWNMFNHKGFFTYNFREQLRDLGLNFIRLWISTYHLFAMGSFLLKKMEEGERPKGASEVEHFLTAWLVLAIALSISTFRVGMPLTSIPIVVGIVGLSLLFHELSHKAVASRLGLNTAFRFWSSGLWLSSIIALFGVFVPAHGSTYMKQADWRYDFRSREVGLGNCF